MANITVDSKVVLLKVKDFKMPDRKDTPSATTMSVSCPNIGENAEVVVSIWFWSTITDKVTFQIQFKNVETSEFDVTIHLLKANETRLLAMRQGHVEYYSDYIKYHDLKSFLHDDQLMNFNCYIQSARESSDVKIINTRQRHGFVGAYKRHLGTDTKFVVEDKVIQVAKFVLIASSPVFEAMFANEWKDTKKGEIVIKGIEYSTMAEFIKSLYSERFVAKDILSAVEVYMVADKYDVEFVKLDALEFMEKNLQNESLANVLQLFRVASLNSIEPVKLLTANHMASNMCEDLVLQILRTAEQYNCEALKASASKYLISLKGKARISQLPGFDQLNVSLLCLVIELFEI